MSFRRRLSMRELLKRRKLMAGKVVLPRRPYAPRAARPLPSLRLGPKTKRILIAIAGLAVLAAAGYFFIFSEAMHTKQVVFYEGKEKVSSPPFPFPTENLIGKHMFFSGFTAIRRDLAEKYPKELQTLEISRKIPSTIEVHYAFFPPVANVSITLQGLARNFSVNQYGIVSGADTADPELPTITGAFGSYPKLRDQLISEDFLAKMVRAYDIFTEKFGMEVPTVLYLKTEREAHLKTARGFWAWLDLTQEVEQQLFKLKRALPKLDIYTLPLDYIDLRISGKTGERVIYKLK